MSSAIELLAAAGMPPLEGPERNAELLVAVAHRCVDWDVWGGPRALRYWDALTERVRAACYAGPTLAQWWTRLTTQMSLNAPSTKGDRVLLAEQLGCGADSAVLACLRSRPEMLVLRVRVAVDTQKDVRKQAIERSTDVEP